MNLEIISPNKKLYSGEVTFVFLPGTDGSFGIMKNHAPLVSTLKQGTIKILQKSSGKNKFDDESAEFKHSLKDDKELTIEVKGGVVEVNNNKIIVLAD